MTPSGRSLLVVGLAVVAVFFTVGWIARGGSNDRAAEVHPLDRSGANASVEGIAPLAAIDQISSPVSNTSAVSTSTSSSSSSGSVSSGGSSSGGGGTIRGGTPIP